MTYTNGDPTTGNGGGGVYRAEAANLNTHSSIGKHPKVRYWVTGEDQPICVQVGAREYEMLRALREGPRNRVDLVRIRPRLGLNATGTVARLRRKRFVIESVWHVIEDSEGLTVRFVTYRLIGKVEVLG